jgi:hypothetical protein
MSEPVEATSAGVVREVSLAHISVKAGVWYACKDCEGNEVLPLQVRYDDWHESLGRRCPNCGGSNVRVLAVQVNASEPKARPGTLDEF